MRWYLLLLPLVTSLAAQEDLLRLPVSQPLHTYGRLELGIDVVGWQPLQCAYLYAQATIQENNKSTTNTFSVQGGYEAGFRLHANYYCECNFLKLSYLWYEENRRKSTATSGIDILGVSKGLADGEGFTEGQLHYRYQNVDLRWGRFLRKTERCTFGVFATARYGRIDHQRQASRRNLTHPPVLTPLLGGNNKPVEENGKVVLVPKTTIATEFAYNESGARAQASKTISENGEEKTVQVDLSQDREIQFLRSELVTVGSYTQKAKFEGGGLGIGLESQWNLWCWFGMRTEVALLGLVGERKILRNSTILPLESNYLKFNNQTAFIPEIDAKIGINYTWYAKTLAVVIEVGYEINYFWKALLLSSDTNKNARCCENIGFAGPYGRVMIRF